MTSVLTAQERDCALMWASEIGIGIEDLLPHLLGEREAEYQRWRENAAMLAREVRAAC